MVEDNMEEHPKKTDTMLKDNMLEDTSIEEDNMDIWNKTIVILNRTEAVLAEFTKRPKHCGPTDRH